MTFFLPQLYNVIVDTESTSKLILQKGQLQTRTTIIPLNKIGGSVINQQIVKLAQNLVGAENVQPALSLISYPEETRSAMTWVFGQTFICKDMDVAKKVAYHKQIMKKCVTLKGDIVDPAGTLSGGAMARGGSILLKLDELKSMERELLEKEQTLQQITNEISRINSTAKEFTEMKNKFDVCNYQLDMVRQRVQQTVHYQIKDEVRTFQVHLDSRLLR